MLCILAPWDINGHETSRRASMSRDLDLQKQSFRSFAQVIGLLTFRVADFDC